MGGMEIGVDIKEIKALDFCSASSKLLDLIVENYLLGFEIGMFLWKKNVEFFINQINQWAVLHQEYNDMIKGKSPFELMNLSESVIKARDTMDFIQKTAERNWLLLNDCINLMLDLD